MKWLVSLFAGEQSDADMAALHEAMEDGYIGCENFFMMGEWIGLVTFYLICAWIQWIAPATGQVPMWPGLIYVGGFALLCIFLSIVCNVLGDVHGRICMKYKDRVWQQKKAYMYESIMKLPPHPRKKP